MCVLGQHRSNRGKRKLSGKWRGKGRKVDLEESEHNIRT